MKKQHVLLIATAVIGIVLGVVIAAVAVLTANPGSAQSEAEPQDGTQAETQIDTQPETEEVSSTELTDAEFVRSMPERDQAHLIAIICLATEEGNAPSDVAESIAESFDSISEEYAQRLVGASLLTVCPELSE